MSYWKHMVSHVFEDFWKRKAPNSCCPSYSIRCDPLPNNVNLFSYQGTTIHAEIPRGLMAEKGSLIQVDKVYELKRFRIAPSRNYFKLLTMIWWYSSLYTQAKVVKDPPPNSPRYVYILTSLKNINDSVDNKTRLIGKTQFINHYFIISYADLFIVLNWHSVSLQTTQMFLE